MEQESPNPLQKFFQFGLHKPIDAPDYYDPKLITFLKEKKNQSNYKSSILQGERAIIC
jgi:hypothetical protein